MRISLQWLKEFVEIDLGPRELAECLTMAGLEVSSVETVSPCPCPNLDEGIVVGQVREVRRHPRADRLWLCQVDVGLRLLAVVCGADNVAQGARVPVALVGATLPDGSRVDRRRIRGEASEGMICSARELGLEEGAPEGNVAQQAGNGIMLLSGDPPIGEPLVRVLGGGDTLLEVAVTPNRPDCLSHLGIAREVAALTGHPLRLPRPGVGEGEEDLSLLTSVTIEPPLVRDARAPCEGADAAQAPDPRERCPRYAARLVMDVRVAPSPPWMQRRLLACGLRPINNVVDGTNHTMLELGQPLHAFDFDRLEGGRIVVRMARAGETLMTLDGVSRSLDPQTLVIADAVAPVALAGIMGGAGTEVTPHTTLVLLESACFHPVGVRRTARRLGLSTEASYRFERGSDPEGVLLAVDRAAQLVADLAGGKVARGRIDVRAHPPSPVQVPLRLGRLQQTLGAPLPEEVVSGCLERLGLSLLEVGATAEAKTGPGREAPEAMVARMKTWLVQIPSFRRDLGREIDLIEEVARLYGYDLLPTSLPRGVVVVPPAATPSWPGSAGLVTISLERRLRSLMAAFGFTEVINYSFVAEKSLDLLSLSPDHPWRRVVPLRNPLNRDWAVMRPSLLPGLLQNLGLNLRHLGRRQGECLRLFELGYAYAPAPHAPLPEQRFRLAAVASGRRHPLVWYHGGGGGSDSVDFFDLKGVLEGLLEEIVGAAGGAAGGAALGTLCPCDLPFLTPGRGAQLERDAQPGERVEGLPLALLGEVSPQVLEGFDLAGPVCLLELDLEGVLVASGGERSRSPFEPLPKYPPVLRDLAVVAPQALPAEQILALIRNSGAGILQQVVLFDVYEGKPIPTGKRGLAFSLTYRSAERTLTDGDVEEVHAGIVHRLASELGVTLREQQ